jgi:putative heme iron utilization protein
VNPGKQQALRHLLDVQRVASLGTLHDGSPYVSMVPFAILRDEAAFVIHVSQLSPHTKDMIESPRVSLLIVASDTGEVPPQALARVTIQGRAERCNTSAPRYSAARESYLSRFPQAADMFELPDFSLFTIQPVAVRFIAGFGQAMSLAPGAFAGVLTA